jgi:hypothetical protein
MAVLDPLQQSKLDVPREMVTEAGQVAAEVFPATSGSSVSVHVGCRDTDVDASRTEP